jgi:hypothetical protein
MKFTSLYLLLLCLAVGAHAAPMGQYGASVGVVAALGNRFVRLGIVGQGWYTMGQVQGIATVRMYRSYTNLGPPGRYTEWVLTPALLVGYGKARVDSPGRWPDATDNHTAYRHSTMYAQNYYLNRIGTRQVTGTLAVQTGNITIATENDILARPTLDRYRTGAMLLQYQQGGVRWGINCTMWTGQMGNKVPAGSGYAPGAYMDTVGGRFTRWSAGLLSGQCRIALPYGQTVVASAGIDAEQVRHAVQNRLIHDLVLIPKPFRHTKSCHIPMLTPDGSQYLGKPGQHIRPVRPYWNVFTNGALFY